MALVLKKTLSNGATGEYWKITHVSIEGLGGNWRIDLFCDKSYADQNQPLPCQFYFAAPVTKEQKTKDLFALGYSLVKESVEELKDAVDG